MDDDARDYEQLLEVGLILALGSVVVVALGTAAVVVWVTRR